MIKVKHFMEAVEPDDGKRLWVEPIGLTLDLQQWCAVHYVLPHFGPPRNVWDWFEERRGSEGYEHFRGVYHEHLDKGQLRKVLLEMVRLSGRGSDFTLLHQGDDPGHNTATALHEYMSELSSYCPPEA